MARHGDHSEGRVIVHREQLRHSSFVKLASTMSKAGFADIEHIDEIVLFAAKTSVNLS